MSWWGWLLLVGCCAATAVLAIAGTTYYLARVYR